MSFERPLLLVAALVAVLALALAYRRAERRQDARALTYSNLAFALGALRPARWPAALLFGAYLAGCGALFVAVAGPRLTARVPVKDGVVMLCIDTSGSMRARDVAPSRAQAARAAALGFIDAIPRGTRVGVVSFAGGADLVSAPTADPGAAREALDRVPAPDGGTAIGDALALAARQMPATGRRIIVLLTDGVNNRGADPLEAAQTAAARGITIETVGVGTSGSGEIIPGTSDAADLDAEALRSIAASAGGRYVGAHDAASLREAFRGIALGTVWQKKRIDAGVPVAVAGGMLLGIAFLTALGSGRLP